MATSANIERIPLLDLSAQEVRKVGLQLCATVKQRATRGMLAARHLPGVIARHSDPGTSIEAVERVRQKMLEGKMAAAVLMREEVYIGMDSLIPELPLRLPRNRLVGQLPAKLTRKSERLATDVTPAGPNITAWLDSAYMSVDYLAPVYEKLRELGGEGSWTLESGERGDVAVESVLEAGLRFWMEPARYDDHEAGGVPPVSTVYAYMPDTSTEGDR